MEVKYLTNTERQDFFIEKSDDLKKIGMNHKLIAKLTGIDYKRFKTMRSRAKPILYPRADELEALIKLHEKKIKKKVVKDDSGLTLESLSERINAQEVFNEQIKADLIKSLERLATEKGELIKEIETLRKKIQ
jgi:hypothetical protein